MSAPTTKDDRTTAVATRPEGAVDRFQELRDVMAAFPPEKFFRLLPSTLQEVSDLFRPVPSAVKFNADDERDVYPTPGGRARTLADVGEDGMVCLRGQALMRLGQLTGIRWLGTTFERDRKEPYRVTAHVRAEWTDAVGERIPFSASATCDYCDGSIGAKKLGGGLEVARQFIDERTESRAMNRIVRKITALPSSFRKREIRDMGFASVRFVLDERRPDVAKAIIERGTRAAEEVFGQRRSDVVDVGEDRPEDEFAGEPIDTRGGSSERAPAEASRAERSGTSGEAAGSSPAPRSAPEDPDPVDEEPAKPAVDQERAQMIRAHVEQLRASLRWGKEAREKRPTAPQAGASVSAIAAALTSSKSQLNVEQKKAVWRAVTEFVFGSFGSYEELNSDQVSTLIDWAKNNAGEVCEVVAFLATSNERIAEIRVALEGQQTLVGGAS